MLSGQEKMARNKTGNYLQSMMVRSFHSTDQMLVMRQKGKI
jgi:hypothetical protein